MIEPGSLLRSLSGRTAARNFHSFVINEIGAGVVAGRYRVGSVLPNDSELMEQFGVSRTVLREALKTLEAKGLLEARPKVGTRVAPHSRWSLFDPQVLAWHLEAPPDAEFRSGLLEVRMALEPRAAAHAAALRSSDQVRLMRYWLQQMEMSGDSVLNFSLADFELHRIIAEASRNPFSRALMGLIELSHALAYLPIGDGGFASSQAMQLAVHSALVQAIEQGDEEHAREAMQLVINTENTIAHRPPGA
jgi:DNA-binding FadR family transcriptional regulator